MLHLWSLWKINSDCRATPSSYGLLRSRGRKVKSYSACWESAGNLLIPSVCLLGVFHLLPCQSQSLHTGCGAADGRWGSTAVSGARGLLAGLSELLQLLKLARVRVKQVKGRSRLKKKKDGWKKGVGKGIKTVNLSEIVREMVFTSIFFSLQALLLNDKDIYSWFPYAVWEPELKTARDFSPVNDWLLFHKHPLLCILVCVQMALCLGTVKRHGILLSLFFFFCKCTYKGFA